MINSNETNCRRQIEFRGVSGPA